MSLHAKIKTSFLLLSLLLLNTLAASARELPPRPAPEFTHQAADEWLNSAPLTLEALRGKVVMLDFWTFECWNCYRSFPWLLSVESQFATDAFTVVGVHSPEFEHEHDISRVKAKSDEFKLHHPIMIDNDFSYWKAMGNRYWPTYYLIDKQGRIRHRFIGETRVGSNQAEAVEAAIRDLLSE